MHKYVRMTSLYQQCTTPEAIRAMTHELNHAVVAIREASEIEQLRLTHLLLELGAITKLRSIYCKQAIPECVIDAVKQNSEYKQQCLHVMLRFALEHNSLPSSAEELTLLTQICERYCEFLAHSYMYRANGSSHKVSEVASLLIYRSALDMRNMPAYEICEMLAQHPTQSAHDMIERAKEELIAEAHNAHYLEAHKNCVSC